MIARLWHGVVPLEKADGYGAYLGDSDLGVGDYQRVPKPGPAEQIEGRRWA